MLKRAAFPFMRATDSLWKRCWTVDCSSSPVWRARALPSLVTSAMATGCHAPKDSAARGVKVVRQWVVF